jgi:type VI secretion system secreted protein Hcp
MQGRAALGGGAATGKATVRELRVTKRLDKASTALMKLLRYNEAIKEATLTIRKAGKSPLEYLTVKIENGRVMSLDIEAGDAANSPAIFEKVTFSFNKITIVYTPQAEDGTPLATSTYEDQWDMNQ